MALKLEGILVANVTPFTPDLKLDEDGLREHIRYLSEVSGLGGVVANGHAGEGATLTGAERRRCIEIIVDEVGGRMPVVACIEAISTPEAIEQALDAKECGAQAIMVCPPPIFSWNASLSPEFAIEYHKALDKAIDMPLVLFQYPQHSPFAYSHQGLIGMAREIENVVAVKLADGGNLRRYETDLRGLRAIPREISVLPTSAREFFQRFITGADGALTGFGNIAPHQCVEMFEAVRRGDLLSSKVIHEQLYPATSAVYCDPHVYLHTRYKEAAFLAGRIRGPYVRPPQLPLGDEERGRMKAALVKSGIISE
ncbi:MAG: dihydrodipicolinate synthase family protein [Dehalococcoidia bacterium]